MFERSGELLQRKFREYLIPTVMTSMAVSLASVVNSAVVGNLLGDEALAAVGLSGPVVYCLNMIYMLFAVGGVTCASIAKGRRNDADANHIFTLSIGAGVAAMALFLVLMLAAMGPVTAALAGGSAELQALTASYLTPLLFVGPTMMFSNGMALFMRSDGSPKMSAAVALIANVVNLIAAYVLIRFFHTGIYGAGLATALGYTVGIFAVFPYLFSKRRNFRFSVPPKSQWRRLLDIFRIGLPKALTQGTAFLRSVCLNAIVLSALGSLGMTAMTVCINALMIANIFIGGISDTLLPIVATLFGERDYFGIRTSLKSAMRILVAACIAVMAFFLIAPETVGGWFGIAAPEGLAVLVPALRMYALSLPFYGLNQMLQNFYATTGREKLASVMAAADGFVFVVAFALVLVQFNGGLIWLAYLLAELATLGFVALIGRQIRRREQVDGLLMLRRQEHPGVEWDSTIPATVEAAAGLSQQVIGFCKENAVQEKWANRMGLAVEEMAANTALYGHRGNRRGVIDILLRIADDKLILRLRDDGIPFDPVRYRTGEEKEFAIGGIEVVKRIAEDISYANQLGFNTTVITVGREELAQGL